MYTTKIGHAHLKVRDLDRAIQFYTRFLNMREVERVDERYAFLTGGEFHHEIALQRVRPDAPTPPLHSTGLYHVAFEMPSARDFAAAYVALTEAGIPAAAVDHGISWAMYFDDPDGNGLELYWDTRGEPDGRALWHGENRALTAETIRRALGAQ